ncbi:YjcQ family protein [Clostridium tertium]
MKIDTKQKVLIAIYNEYQKDIPNMKENVNSKKLGLESEVFSMSLVKLINEGLIIGVKFTKGGGRILGTFLDNMMITSYGIDYVETKLGIEKTLDGFEKMKYIASKCVELGWSEAKDIFTTTLAKTIRGE